MPSTPLDRPGGSSVSTPLVAASTAANDTHVSSEELITHDTHMRTGDVGAGADTSHAGDLPCVAPPLAEDSRSALLTSPFSPSSLEFDAQLKLDEQHPVKDATTSSNRAEEASVTAMYDIPAVRSTGSSSASTEPAITQIISLTPTATAVQPPLTPIKEQRKRAFGADDEPPSPSPAVSQMPPPTFSSPARNTPSPPVTAAPALGSFVSTAEPPVVSPVIDTSISWPWHFVSAYAGAANAAYADFKPKKPDDYELPAVDATDWWGMGSASPLSPTSPTAPAGSSSSKIEEMKSSAAVLAPEDDSMTATKRQRLSNSGRSGSGSSSENATGASTPITALLAGGGGRAIPWDSASCLSLLGQMGQDSFFAVSNAALGCAVMGVADGVGGWRDNGVDSGEISRAIMRAARNFAVRTCSDAASAESKKDIANFMLNPSSLLTLAYLDVKASKMVEAGSTTACIVALTPQPVTAMHAASSTPSPNTPATQSIAAGVGSMSLPGAVDLYATAAAASVATLTAASLANMFAGDGFNALMSAMTDVSALEMNASPASTSESMATPSYPIAIGGSTHAAAAVPASAASSVPMSNSSPEPMTMQPGAPPEHAGSLVPPTPPAPAQVDQDAAALEAAYKARHGETVYLSAANLGDSGYMILRRDEAGVYRIIQMSDLQRTGRTVKQLAIIPERFANDSYCNDLPEEAELDAHVVREDDLIILATDGLWSGKNNGSLS